MRAGTFLVWTLIPMVSSVRASAEIRIVTTTEDLAAIAREVGGDLVKVESIARGYQDPHFVEAKPSHLLKLRRADLYMQMGVELEITWAPALVQNARAPHILPGRPGFLDVSEGCEILQKPTGPVDRLQGHVHPLGNPHYWTDPENGRVIARNIARRLSELDPDSKARFDANLKRFEARLDQKLQEWKRLAAPLRGARVVTYHNSWANFAKRFGLEVVNYVEPRPGVPPSPAHLRALIEQIRKEKIPLILMETYWDPKIPQKVARESGAALVVFPASVGGESHIRTYFDLFDNNLGRLAEAFKRPAGSGSR